MTLSKARLSSLKTYANDLIDWLFMRVSGVYPTHLMREPVSIREPLGVLAAMSLATDG
jgi:hypothetical protein